MKEEAKRFTSVLKNFDKDYPPFCEEFKKFCQENGIGDSIVFDMEVSLEELVVNSFSYGSSKGPIMVVITIQDGGLQIKVEDTAPPFNLLREAPDPPKGPLADREIGGLGIHLVKNLSDRVEYSYSNNKNIITLFKSV